MVPSGAASWRRIASASIPPTRKKNIAVVAYMIAIFLWSTVVNQLHGPVVARGRSRIRVRTGGPTRAAASLPVGTSTALPGRFVTGRGIAQQEICELLR